MSGSEKLVRHLTILLISMWLASPGSHKAAEVGGGIDVTLVPQAILDGNGNVQGYNWFWGSIVPTLSVELPLIVPISIRPEERDGLPLYWGDTSPWGGVILPLSRSFKITQQLAQPFLGQVPTVDGAVELHHALANGGPTETSISVGVDLFSLDTPIIGAAPSLSVGVLLKYDVTIPSGASVILNQDSIVERLTVNEGGIIGGTSEFLTVRTDFENQGYAYSLRGSIEGDFVNESAAEATVSLLTVRGGLFNKGNLVAFGRLTLHTESTNQGTIGVLSGGHLNPSERYYNDGFIYSTNGTLFRVFNRSTMTITNTTLSICFNDRTLSMNGGTISSLTNAAQMRVAGNATVKVGRLVNWGTIAQEPQAILELGEDTELVNEAGAVYDLLGDGGFSDGSGTIGGSVYNQGLLRKSGGSGTCVLESAIYGSGIVESASGTLVLIKSINRITNGVLRAVNGATLKINGRMVLYGDNRVEGNGTVSVGAWVQGENAANVTLTGTTPITVGNGGILTDVTTRTDVVGIGGGTISRVFNDASMTLTNTTASVVNNGTLSMNGGTIGSLTNAAQMRVAGNGTVKVTGQLVNRGTIVQEPQATLLSVIEDAALVNETGAVYDLLGDGGIDSVEVYNYGLLRKSGGSGTSTISYIYGSGILEAASGTLQLSGGTSRITNGVFRAVNGAILRLDGRFILNGTQQFEGNGTIRVGAWVQGLNPESDILTGTAPITVASGGMLTDVTTRTDVVGAGGGSISRVLNQSSMTLTNTTASVVNNGTLSMNGGTISSLTNAAQMRVAGNGTVKVTVQLVNRGTIVQEPQATLELDGTGDALVNEAGAVYELLGDVGFADGSGSGIGEVYNYGLLRKSGGTGTSTIRGGVRNAGILEVSTGTLEFANSFTQTSGVTRLLGGDIKRSGILSYYGGIIQGSGSINATLWVYGDVGISASVGGIVLTGTVNTTASSRLTLLGGAEMTNAPLRVTSTANFSGALLVDFPTNYLPGIGETLKLMTYGSRNGQFQSVTGVGRATGYQFTPIYGSTGLNLQVTALGTNYLGWLAAKLNFNQRQNGSLLTPSSDADGDGIPNIVEYALGTHAGVSNAAPALVCTLEQGQFQIRLPFRQGDPAIGLGFETSTSLTGWSPSQGVMQQIGSPQDTSEPGVSWVTYRMVGDINTTPIRFIRLVINHF